MLKPKFLYFKIEPFSFKSPFCQTFVADMPLLLIVSDRSLSLSIDSIKTTLLPFKATPKIFYIPSTHILSFSLTHILYLSEYEQNQHILHWKLKFSFGHPPGANDWAICKVISVSSAIIGDIFDRYFKCIVIFRFNTPAIVCDYGLIAA